MLGFILYCLMVSFEALVDEYASRCDYVDARVTDSKHEDIFLSNGEAMNDFSENFNYGVRVLYRGGWGFYSGNDFRDVRSVFEKALRIARLSEVEVKERFSSAPGIKASRVYPCKVDPFSVDPDVKSRLIKEYYSLISKCSLFRSSSVGLTSSFNRVKVYAPGVSVVQEFNNCFLDMNVAVKDRGDSFSVSDYKHHLGGFDFISSINPEVFVNEFISKSKRLLNAKLPKSGRADVVCDPEMTGLLFHEAVGHACEADNFIGNSSIFSGLRGKRVASEEVNLIDDPTVDGNGFYWFDDEGVKARPTQLITNGVLTGLLHSLYTANKLHEEPTGNGRCMSARWRPIPRMSNTVLRNGNYSFDELVSEVRNGYLVKGNRDGIVDSVTGEFNFTADECFRIVNGCVGEALKGVTLGGNILDVLKTVKVGNDAKINLNGGFCKKSGQEVRVNDYCPSVLVKGVMVSGHS